MDADSPRSDRRASSLSRLHHRCGSHRGADTTAAPGDITVTDGAAAVAQFHQDFAQRYRLIDLTPPLVAQAMALAETHSLRGYDAVQLATAVEIHVRGLTLGLPALTLVSADEELNLAARAEGLVVEDPNMH